MSNELEAIKNEAGQALEGYERAQADLLFQGRPLYAPEIHNEKERAARSALTDQLAALNERAQAVKASAEATRAAATANPHAWLSDSELARAYHLRPFVAEDVAAGGVAYLAETDTMAQVGRLQVDRAHAWLLYRAAVAAGVDAPFIERLAWPAEALEAEKTAAAARLLLDDLRQADPLYKVQQLQRTGFNVTY